MGLRMLDINGLHKNLLGTGPYCSQRKRQLDVEEEEDDEIGGNRIESKHLGFLLPLGNNVNSFYVSTLVHKTLSFFINFDPFFSQSSGQAFFPISPCKFVRLV